MANSTNLIVETERQLTNWLSSVFKSPAEMPVEKTAGESNGLKPNTHPMFAKSNGKVPDGRNNNPTQIKDEDRAANEFALRYQPKPGMQLAPAPQNTLSTPRPTPMGR